MRPEAALRPLPSRTPRAAAGAALDKGVDGRLLLTQISSVYAHVAKASVISTFLALALALYLGPILGETAAHVWLALKTLISAGRFVLSRFYKAGAFHERPVLAERFLVGSLMLDGLVWGLPGLWAMHAPGETVSLVMACLCGVSMLATFALQVHFRSTAGYVVPMLVPAVVAMLLRRDALGLFGACGMVLTVVQTLVTGYASERRMSREFRSQEDMVQALGDRSTALAQVSEANSKLEVALSEVQRQSAIKALFLGTMSHELRTPLHGILGLAELVKGEVEDPVMLGRLELLEASGTHLLEIIGSLLDISRIDSGRLELHLAPFDLDREVGQLTELYKVRCAAKGIGFDVSIDLPGSTWVIGDAARVRQILHNLLGNAVKFTQRGQVRFSVKAAYGACTFIVSDTGTGIADNELPKIFDAFTQVGASVARPADGTGLGLTIARELALAMGGDITAASNFGVGSTFTFNAALPSANVSSLPARAEPQVKAIRRLNPGCRVLLVEDNDVNALIATAHLEQLGAEVIRAVNGKEAVAACFGDHRPTVVLMDCRMPVMDGPTATREIRSVEKSLGRPPLPVVALTATASEGDRRECFDAGMNGFLTKPFNAEKLMDLLSTYVGMESAVMPLAVPTLPADHPMLDFARSLDDMEPDLFGSNGGVTVH